MNWNQLYTTSTEQERLETLINMLQVIEARQNKIVFTGNHIIRNRRRNTTQPFHFIGEKRGRYQISRIVSVISILASLFSVSGATLLFAIHTPTYISLQVLFFQSTAILFVLLFKPKRQMLKTNG